MKRYKPLFESIIKRKIDTRTGTITRMSLDSKGYIDYQYDQENNILTLIMVETYPEYKNQGVAKKLLDDLFRRANNKKTGVDVGVFLEDGEKFLSHIIDNFKKKYKDIYWV